MRVTVIAGVNNLEQVLNREQRRHAYNYTYTNAYCRWALHS